MNGRRGLVGLAAVLTSVTATACGVLFGDSSEPVLPSRPDHATKAQRVAQLSFGRNARFAVCIEPACPGVTPKTLALSPPSVPPEDGRTAALTQHGQTEEPAASPREQASPPPSSEPESREERVTVNFVFGRATLTDDGRQTLRRAIPLARSADRIVINGRTDSVGPDAVNQQLAFARALAVRDFIRAQAPDLPHDIGIHARGNCCFVADNATAEGRQKNRRVEVVFNLKV